MSNAAATLQPPTPDVSKPTASATTCVVGCKLPNGMTVELIEGKGKDARSVWKHTLKGMNSARIVGGYGLTEGVSAEHMKEWLTRNAEHPAVKNGAIFMHTSGKGAEARAKEGREIRTGLDAIDPVANARRAGIELDREAVAAYEKQKAENPLRDRQVVE